jgi:hypothetical protein
VFLGDLVRFDFYHEDHKEHQDGMLPIALSLCFFEFFVVKKEPSQTIAGQTF